MSVGRYVRGLNAYDLLGNLIPGTIGLIAIMGFLPSPPIPTDIGEYGLFIAVAFVIGAISQGHASKAAGPRKGFERTMGSAEDFSFLPEYVDDDSGDDGNDNDIQGNSEVSRDGDSEESMWWKFHPFIGPLCGWWRPKRGEKMDDAILANRIWAHLMETHKIPFKTESYSVLYRLMLSRVDNIQSPSRAIRIQAIRNFYRGMWIISWDSFLLIGFAIIGDNIFNVGDTVPLIGVEYAQSAYFEYWSPVWHLVIIAIAGVLVFWFLFESAEEDYLEYLFTDYAVSIGSEDISIVFKNDNGLAVSAEVRAKVESDNEPDDDVETLRRANRALRGRISWYEKPIWKRAVWRLFGRGP